MSERMPWICARCGRSNAPHTDFCDCAGGDAIGIPMPPIPPMPYIPPLPPPYPWWHPSWPFRITVSDNTKDSLSFEGSAHVLTVYATNENNALLKFSQNTATAVQ